MKIELPFRSRSSHFITRLGIRCGVILFFLFVSVNHVEAANRYWAGAGASDVWEDANNWASVEQGAGGAGVPGATDTAILSFSGGTVQIRSAVSIGGLILAPVWTGSLLQGTGTLTVGSSGVKVGSGRLVGGNAAITISGVYTQTGGIVTGIQNTFTLSDSFSVTKGGSSSNSTFTSTGTIVFNGTADQNFTVGTNVTKSFTNLTLNNSGGGTADDIVVSIDGGLNLSGALTVTLGNLDLTTNSQAMVVDGGITLANAAQASLTTNSNVTASGTILVNDAAVLTVTAGTWTLADDVDQTVDLDGQSLFNLTLNNSGGGTNDDVIIAGGGLNLSGALTVTLGNLDLTTNSQAMVVDGGITLANAAQASLTTNSNVTASGTILVNNSAILTVTAGTWTLNGDGDQSVDLDGQSLFNLTLNNSGGGTNDDVIIAGGGLNLSGALTVTLGNLDLDTNTQSLDVDGNAVLANSAQATLSGATMNFGSGLTVNTLATFTHTTGTVTLDGTTNTLSGSITFYNLTKSVTSRDTLTFIAGTTQTITNTLTLNGVAGNLLLVVSSQSGTPWTIDPQGTRTVSYLYVKDSNNINSTNITCTTGCTDGGQNSKWTFATTTTTTTTTTTSSGGGGGGGGARKSKKIVTALEGRIKSPAYTAEEREQQYTVVARGMLQVTIDGRDVTFDDVPIHQWFAPYVSLVIESGIASGYRDTRGRLTGKYGPANNVTYAEIAKMALQTAHKDIDAVKGSPRNRSARGQWSEKYIKLAENLSLSVYESSLDVNTPATRGAVVQTILEALGISLDEEVTDIFRDLRPGYKYARALSTAARLGIISGDADSEGNLVGTVRPNANINRAEVAKILAKVMELRLDK